MHAPSGPAPVTEKRNRWLILFLLILLLAGAAVLIAGLSQRPPPAYEPNATVGAMPGKTDEDRLRALQAAQDEAIISYTVNSHPVFANGAAMGEWLLDCPAGNFNKLQFVITRDRDGVQLYDSGPMGPGSYILQDYIQTRSPLAKGDYDCTVAVKVLDAESEQEKGCVEVKIVVSVQS